MQTEQPKKAKESPLQLGNTAFRQGDKSGAIRHYIQALVNSPGLSRIISANLVMARKKYRAERRTAGKPRVGVCGWELAHNAAGRVYTLAMLYQTFADVEIIGSLFPSHGREVWEPIRGTPISKHTFVVEDEARFMDQAIQLVAAHPYDIVHLSKPRAPNIFFGILYKLIWDAKVLMDIDDEELAFVDADTPISADDYIQQHGKLPGLKDLAGKDWTRLAVGMVNEFDGITVCNTPLQQRYGGEIIRHARDERLFNPSPELTRQSREKFGIPPDKKVVLFFGTPREHKGLIETAQAIAAQKRSDILFCVVGDFPDPAFRERLQEIRGCSFLFLPNQPFKAIPEVVSIADYCILMQDEKSTAAQFQTPAKLTDALAAGLVLIVSNVSALRDIIKENSAIAINNSLGDTFKQIFLNEKSTNKVKIAAHDFFHKEMSFAANSPKLQVFVETTIVSNKLLDADFSRKYLSHNLIFQWLFENISSKLIFSKEDYSGSSDTAKDLEPFLHKAETSASAELVQTSARNSNKGKLPITVLVITWDVGHNPLGRSYMLAEVVRRVARHTLLVGFQFPRYGDAIWEPVREGQLPVIALPGSNLPEFYESLQAIAARIHPDVVIACKPRLPSVALGVMIKEKWGCPLIVDIDDHELSFFKDQSELTLTELAAMPVASASSDVEPYSELWTRLTQSLCRGADEIIVSNTALQKMFGGTIVAHVRDENTFDPTLYDKIKIRQRHGVPIGAKVVLFFGTPRIHKGVDTLARAVNQIKDPNFRLLIVGTAPDRSVTAKLDQLAPGRVIYLPNQPFSSIPEILAMADVVCLPQDEGHATSQYQLPAKAIDAVAMGIPLLVTNTPPLRQLVHDRVAELVDTEDIPAALERLGGSAAGVDEWRQKVRGKFLQKYSYANAAEKLREIIQKVLKSRQLKPSFSSAELINASNRVLGKTTGQIRSPIHRGTDIVLFWKQNDTGVYGRRHDMIIKYLAQRSEIRKVIVIDAAISEYDLLRMSENSSIANQDRSVFVSTYEKLLGIQDSPRISYNVFVYPPGKYRYSDDGTSRKDLFDGYKEYLEEVFRREEIIAANAIFWVYPKNFHAPKIIEAFNPLKVVVDVVDDHRAWPGVTSAENERLTNNYREILGNADLVMANCLSVQEAMREFHPDILLVPNACDTNPPMESPKNSPDFEAFQKWPGKTIGYVGNLESKIDIKLLEKIAESFPTCQIVLIGSTHANKSVLDLKRYTNVRMPGVVPYKQVGAWVSRFDVGLIPHLNTNLTQNMNPLKLFVYLALNVPVVSTEIENIERKSELVKVAEDHTTFISFIESILKSGRPDGHIAADYAAKNSWQSRLSLILDKFLE